jgi:UDP-galactopyranose mutase
MGKYDILIVGAGLTGATVARVLTDAGKSCLIIDQRDHIAGNCYDEKAKGINICRYGGHIFHTNSLRIWRFAKRFAEWERYEHRVKAHYQDKFYSFPINLTTLYQVFGVETPTQARLMMQDEGAVNQLYDMFYRGYSKKQWGKELEDVPKNAISRLPIRITWDDRYFNDTYQAMPKGGYTGWIRRMISGIDYELNTQFDFKDFGYWLGKANRIFYSGLLDGFFGNDLGYLEYRSLRFNHKWLKGDYQGIATVNYTDESVPFTRILEHKHYGWQLSDHTAITHEYPEAYNGENEPYYPVNDDHNARLYRQYNRRAKNIEWLEIGGRLGAYQYIDMSQAIAQGIRHAERILENG